MRNEEGGRRKEEGEREDRERMEDGRLKKTFRNKDLRDMIKE